jgi:AcrR family transcriptional regulator
MKSRNTRQQILDATQRLIEKGGFARLTTREIALKAGCAEGTIFKYFKHKDDLCLSVVLENAPRFKGILTAKRAGRRTVQKNLQDIASASLHFSEKLIPLAAALFADVELLSRQRQALNESRGGPKEAFDLIATYISDEQQLGRIRPDVEPLTVSVLLLGSCFHRAFLRQAMGKNLLPMSDQEFVAALVSTLMRGLSPVNLTSGIGTGVPKPRAGASGKPLRSNQTSIRRVAQR